MIRVLVVEDDAIAAEAHASYVGRVGGYEVAGTAGTGHEALRLMGDPAADVDLVLLDMNLPDMHGLDVCRRLRAGGHPADVIAVTSARDLAVVRAATSLGIVQYVLKPFAFSALREKLETYAAYRQSLSEKEMAVAQHDVDALLATLRGRAPVALPKGLSAASLDAIVAAVRDADAGLSAAEVADLVGASRVTARRYLEHLADLDLADRVPRYGGAGRPEVEYRWRGTPRGC